MDKRAEIDIIITIVDFISRTVYWLWKQLTLSSITLGSFFKLQYHQTAHLIGDIIQHYPKINKRASIFTELRGVKEHYSNVVHARLSSCELDQPLLQRREDRSRSDDSL